MGKERTSEQARLLFRAMVLSIVAGLYMAAILCMVLVFVAFDRHTRGLAIVVAMGAFFLASLAGTSVAWAADMLRTEREWGQGGGNGSG